MAFDAPNDAYNVSGCLRRSVHVPRYQHTRMPVVPERAGADAMVMSSGGDLTFFKVERTDGSAMPYIDVLACGNGQYGGLGNAAYSNGQSTPVRARNVSGLLECTYPT